MGSRAICHPHLKGGAIIFPPKFRSTAFLQTKLLAMNRLEGTKVIAKPKS
jgi:hypothetical protein